MNKRKLRKQLKELMIDQSKPNCEDIRSKIQSKAQDIELGRADVLVRSNKRTALILSISIFLIVALALSIILPLCLIGDEMPFVNTPTYFDGGMVEWDYDFDLAEYNRAKGTKLMEFHNFDKGSSASATNIEGYFWLTYTDESEDEWVEIDLEIFTENRLLVEYKSYTEFQNSLVWKGNTVKYNKQSIDDTGEVYYNAYIFDVAEKCNYIINISYICGNNDCKINLEDFLKNFYYD